MSFERRKNPEPVGKLLDGVLERLGVARPVDVNQLVGEWGRIASEPWASRSRPVGLRDTILTVETEDSTVASLLKYNVNSLLDSLENELGKGLVTAVRVQVVRRTESS